MPESSRESIVKRHLPVTAEEFGPRFNRTLIEIMPEMLRRAERIGYVNLHDVDSEIVQTDIDAAYSFVFGLYAATIFFASRAVEMAINADSRMRELKESDHQKWLNLNRKNLREARDKGLPICCLLSAGENALLDNSEGGSKCPNHGERKRQPIFLERRNKLVHGDMIGYRKATGFYDARFDVTMAYDPRAPTEDDACDQLTKSRSFLIQWAESGHANPIRKGVFFFPLSDIEQDK